MQLRLKNSTVQGKNSAKIIEVVIIKLHAYMKLGKLKLLVCARICIPHHDQEFLSALFDNLSVSLSLDILNNMKREYGPLSHDHYLSISLKRLIR